MSRQPQSTASGGGQGAASAPYEPSESRYINVSHDCHIVASDEVLTGAAQVAILRCGRDYYVAVIEGRGSMKSVYAMYRDWTWDRAREVMEELADIYDVCIEFEAYDVCLEEEVHAAVWKVLTMQQIAELLQKRALDWEEYEKKKESPPECVFWQREYAADAKCTPIECADIWLGVMAVACKRDKKRIVAVLELRDGQYHVVEESDSWTWEQAIMLAAELAKKRGICAGNEFCNKCLQQAVNEFAETIMRLARRV